MSSNLDALIDRLTQQGACRQELRRTLREKRGGELPRSDKRALTLAYRQGGQAAFILTWARLMQRPHPRTRMRPVAHRAHQGAAFRPAAPRQRRAQSRVGPQEPAEPEPVPAPLFADPAGAIALRRLSRSLAWQRLDPGERERIARLCAGELTPAAVALIEETFAQNALDRGENLGAMDLWLGGPIPPMLVIFRDKLGLWRCFEAGPVAVECFQTRGTA
jgi:hypothetical protein